MAKDPTDTYKYWDFECQTFDYSHHLIITAKFSKDGDFGEPSAAPPVPAVAFLMPPTQHPIPQPPTSQPPALPLMPQQPTSSTQAPILYDVIVVEPPPADLKAFNTASQPLSNAAEPVSYQDALSRPDASQWIQAMDEEMDSIHYNGTWNL